MKKGIWLVTGRNYGLKVTMTARFQAIYIFLFTQDYGHDSIMNKLKDSKREKNTVFLCSVKFLGNTLFLILAL